MSGGLFSKVLVRGTIPAAKNIIPAFKIADQPKEWSFGHMITERARFI